MSRKRHEIETKSDNALTLAGHVYDRAKEELRTADGRLVRLRPQSGRVLAILACAPGEVVSKQDLIEEVWQSVFTTDDSLVQCIADIRRVLGRGCIETFPRRGYRLRTEASDLTETLRSKAARPAHVVTAGLAALLAAVTLILLVTLRDGDIGSSERTLVAEMASGPSLAVLPCSNLGGDPDLQYLSDGLSEDLATDLSKVRNLRVTSPAASFVYRDAESEFGDIARALGVRHLVRGTVRYAGHRVRINVGLIDARGGETIWAERFDRSTEDVFALQDEVAGAIVSALSLELAIDQEAPRQVDPDAYDLLLRGLEPMRRFTAAGNQEARSYFERAIALDPNYARAYANLALSYGRDVVFRYQDDDSAETMKGLKAAETAIHLDPNIPQAHFALGVLNLALRRHRAAFAAARRTVEIDPNYADGYALLATLHAHGGDLAEGLAAIQRAKTLHPLPPFSYLWVEGHLLFLQGRYEEALPHLEEAVARNPAFYVGLVTLAAAYGQMGMTDAAEWTATDALALNPDFSVASEIKRSPYEFQGRRRLLEQGLRRAGVED